MNERRGVWVAGRSASLSRWLKTWPQEWRLEDLVAALAHGESHKMAFQSSSGISSRIAHR